MPVVSLLVFDPGRLPSIESLRAEADRGGDPIASRHIAKICCNSKLGRNRGIADMDEPPIGSTRSRLTRSGLPSPSRRRRERRRGLFAGGRSHSPTVAMLNDLVLWNAANRGSQVSVHLIRVELTREDYQSVTMKTMRISILIALAAWLAIFFFGVLPYAGIRTLKVKSRPHVVGFFSNYRVVSGTKGSRYVLATLDFDRSSSEGVVHCKIDPYQLGLANTEASKLSSAQFAVRIDSCAETIQLPLSSPHDLWAWIRLIFTGSMYAALAGCFFGFAVLHDYVGKRRSPT
jgi:hypothetical protein